MNCLISVISILCSVVLLGCSDDLEFDTAAAKKNQAEGWAAYDQGDFSGALLKFERAIDLDPNVADAHNGLGWSHLSESRKSSMDSRVIAKAQEAFEGAIRLDASNADAWIGLANTLFLRRERASDFQTALHAINNALKTDHRTLFRHDYQSAADLYTLRAVCYYYLGETGLARFSIETALEIDPPNTAALSLQQLLKQADL
jgi:tetratricopeptide (TPR) repeat protein